MKKSRFNEAQIEGLPDRFAAPPPGPADLDPSQRFTAADAFFATCGVAVRHRGDRADTSAFSSLR